MASSQRPRRRRGQLTPLSTMSRSFRDGWIGLAASILVHLALFVTWRSHVIPDPRFEPDRTWQSLRVTFIQRAPRPDDVYIPEQRVEVPRTRRPTPRRLRSLHRLTPDLEVVNREKKALRERLNLEGLAGKLVLQSGSDDVLLGDDLFEPTLLGDWLRRRRSQHSGEVVVCSLRIYSDGTWTYRERARRMTLRERGVYRRFGDTLFVHTRDSTEPGRIGLAGRVRYEVEGTRLELKPLPSGSVDFAWLRLE